MLAFWIIAAVTGLLALTSLLPRSNRTVWWVRVWDFPRLQQSAVALILLITSAFFLPADAYSTWLLVSIQLLCGAWQFWWIFPYTPFAARTIRMHCVHPAPPSPTENEKSKQRDNELMLVAKRARNEQGPVIVTGDLNDVAWSKSTRAFLQESQLLDPRMGRGIYNTFHAKIPIMRWPLDHVFHSDHFMLVELKRLPPFGSDHFALLSELALKREE